MDKLEKWIQDKIREGYPKDEIKEALKREDFDPELVDDFLEKKHFFRAKKLLFLILLIICCAFLIMITYLYFNISNNSDENQELEESLLFNYSVSYGNIGFINPVVDFKIIENGILYQKYSNLSNSLLVVTARIYENTFNNIIDQINHSISLSYSDVYLKEEKNLSINNVDVFYREYSLLEINKPTYIKNAFFDYKNKVLYLTMKYYVEDKDFADELFSNLMNNIILLK